MSLFKSASTVSLFTLVSRITGLLREFMMAAIFGATALTDAFNVAFRIPNMLRRIFAEGAFSQAFVPVLSQVRTQEGEAESRDLVNHVSTVLFWAVLVTALIGIIASPFIVWVMASGLQAKPGAFDAAIFMTRVMFPYIVCMSIVALASAVLNTYKKFAIPAATPVLLNIAMILALWLGAPYCAKFGFEPIYALPVGVMLGGLLQVGLQLYALRGIQMLPRIAWRWSQLRAAFADAKIRRILKLMGAALIGVSVAQISLLINTQIASHLAAGSVSWLTYADRLMEFPVAMLGVALSVVLMPQLSAAKASQDEQRYSQMIDWGLRIVLMLGLPCSVVLLAFAEPLVSTLFQRGAFHVEDTRITAQALMGYGFGLMGLLSIKILAPAFYASQNVKTPVKIAFVVLLATQALNLILVPQLQLAGLALSIGLGALLNASLLLWGLLQRKAYTPLSGWMGFLLKLIIANALLAGFLIWLGQRYDWPTMATGLERIIYLAGALGCAALLYLASLYALKLPVHKILRSA